MSFSVGKARWFEHHVKWYWCQASAKYTHLHGANTDTSTTALEIWTWYHEAKWWLDFPGEWCQLCAMQWYDGGELAGSSGSHHLHRVVQGPHTARQNRSALPWKHCTCMAHLQWNFCIMDTLNHNELWQGLVSAHLALFPGLLSIQCLILVKQHTWEFIPRLLISLTHPSLRLHKADKTLKCTRV